MPKDTSLYWWIETFTLTGRQTYPFFVVGYLEDVAYPAWPENGRPIAWHIPSLTRPGGGGQYAFKLREVR